MSLHGEIAVNRTVVGVWRARRLNHLTGTDDVHEYECHVEWLPLKLTQPVAEVEFNLMHRYSDGAIALAASVLTHAAKAA